MVSSFSVPRYITHPSDQSSPSRLTTEGDLFLSKQQVVPSYVAFCSIVTNKKGTMNKNKYFCKTKQKFLCSHKKND